MASRTDSESASPQSEQRARGLRPVELWVWDNDSPEFQALLREEMEITRAQAGSADERDALRWSEAAFDELMEEIEAEEQRAGTKLP
jgi:hypothetical protein